jgi:AcrR family transcriptional regulator
MGISQRKQREKEDLKRRILDAATELFIQKGFEETSIRNIAQIIEYSPTTIYLYFKDKAEILHAIHSDAFALLNSRFAVLQYISDPFERLKAMGKIYLDFAMEHKALYDLMFILKEPMDSLEKQEKEDWNEGKRAFEGLKETVKVCIDQGYFPEADPEVVSFYIWSSLHGMCSLEIRCRCTRVISDENLDNMVNKGYEVMVAYLETLKKCK